MQDQKYFIIVKQLFFLYYAHFVNGIYASYISRNKNHFISLFLSNCKAKFSTPNEKKNGLYKV